MRARLNECGFKCKNIAIKKETLFNFILLFILYKRLMDINEDEVVKKLKSANNLNILHKHYVVDLKRNFQVLFIIFN